MRVAVKIFIFIFILNFVALAWSAQKAKIVGPEVEIYSDADFDADIISVVKKGESYMVSDKVQGAFYKIKLKSGKIGFIPDYEVDIEGKGRVQPKDFDEMIIGDEVKDVDENKKSKRAKLEAKAQQEEDEDPEDELDRTYRGITLQLINYHEDTLGGVQVDDLLAVGYKSLGDLSWEVLAAFKPPKYYSEKLNASVNGFNLWADFGISNRMEINRLSTLRYGAAFFAHASQIRIATPAKTYDMQDITAGVLLEGALMVKVYRTAVDFSLKYFFDRNPYGGFGVSLMF